MRCADIRHDLLKKRVMDDRKFNVSEFCRDHNLSRTQFYDVLEGRRYVSEEMIKKIIVGLGLAIEQVITTNEKKSLSSV